MNGCIIPHTPIAVDFWKLRECSHCRIFFLTHLHGDHITGLTSSWNYPIYCSEITMKLLVQRYGVREELIHPLQTGQSEIIYLDEVHQEQMVVTALDANHCPGSVMFLMQGYFGTILHTGDFRYKPEMITETCLKQLTGKIDVLYLDNTYCSPRCRFPSREDATSTIIKTIESHPNHDILIAMRNLGKEQLLCDVALRLREWIYVPEKFYQTLEILEAPNVFDCDSLNHRIRVVPFQKVSRRFVEKLNEKKPTLVIMPTALYVGINAKPYENDDNVVIVPYSDHSSFCELKEFVSGLKPKQIIPVVKGTARGPFGMNISERADMSVFSEYTRASWNKKIDIPPSVQAHMEVRAWQSMPRTYRRMKRKPETTGLHQSKKAKRGVSYESPKAECKVSEIGSKNSGNPTAKQKLFHVRQKETSEDKNRKGEKAEDAGISCVVAAENRSGKNPSRTQVSLPDVVAGTQSFQPATQLFSETEEEMEKAQDEVIPCLQAAEETVINYPEVKHGPAEHNRNKTDKTEIIENWLNHLSQKQIVSPPNEPDHSKFIENESNNSQEIDTENANDADAYKSDENSEDSQSILVNTKNNPTIHKGKSNQSNSGCVNNGVTVDSDTLRTGKSETKQSTLDKFFNKSTPVSIQRDKVVSLKPVLDSEFENESESCQFIATKVMDEADIIEESQIVVSSSVDGSEYMDCSQNVLDLDGDACSSIIEVCQSQPGRSMDGKTFDTNSQTNTETSYKTAEEIRTFDSPVQSNSVKNDQCDVTSTGSKYANTDVSKVRAVLRSVSKGVTTTRNKSDKESSNSTDYNECCERRCIYCEVDALKKALATCTQKYVCTNEVLQSRNYVVTGRCRNTLM